eukprot:g594.t1
MLRPGVYMGRPGELFAKKPMVGEAGYKVVELSMPMPPPAVQQAYEVLGDADKRRRYDNQKAFFSEESGEEWEGADSGFKPPGDPVTTWAQLTKIIDMDEPCVIHVYSDQRHYFGQWMFEVAQEVKLAHLNVFTADEAQQTLVGSTGFGGSILFVLVYSFCGQFQVAPDLDPWEHES